MTPEGLTSYEMLNISEAKIKANLEQLRAIRDQYDAEIIRRLNSSKQ